MSNRESFITETGDRYENDLIRYWRYRAGDQTALLDCLAYLDFELRSIIRRARCIPTSDKTLLLWITETCYDQATFSDGVLWPARAYEASVDFDAQCRDCTIKEERQDSRCLTFYRCWQAFWKEQLQQAGGPLLFVTGSVDRLQVEMPRCPRILWRVFDSYSAGFSDSSVVISAANTTIDLLAMDESTAARMLARHLSARQSKSDLKLDNLMSWTSSLITAFHYAIFKTRFGPADAIWICCVDTTRFPRGQFIRDVWLLTRLANKAKLNSDNLDIKHLRYWRDNGFDGGEYLTQGTLQHCGRSCTFNLQAIIDAGLYQLYPSLETTRTADDKWNKSASVTRQLWDSDLRPPTSIGALRATSGIAVNCFREFRPFLLAVVLLLLKPREIKLGALRATNILAIPSDPVDVVRYEQVLQSLDYDIFDEEALPTIEELKKLFVPQTQSSLGSTPRSSCT